MNDNQTVTFYKFSDGVYLYRGSSIYNGYVNKETPLQTNKAYSNVDEVYTRIDNRLPAQLYFDGTPISSEQHQKNISSYLHRNDDEVEYLYPGAKEDYKVYLSKITTEAKSETVWTKLKVEIKEIPEISSEDSEFMEPMLTVDSSQFGLVLFKKAAYAKHYFYQVAADNNMMVSNASSGIRFAKIGGNYVCSDDMDYSSCVGDLKSMQTQKENVTKKIDAIFTKLNAKKIVLDKKSLNEIIVYLEHIQKSVSDLEVMKKSVSDKQIVSSYIQNKIKELYLAASNQE